MRVLYELAHADGPTATDLGRDLGLDAGYLSRILRRFERGCLIGRAAAPADARQSLLRLTRKGRAAFAPLEARARGDVAALLDRAEGPARRQIVEAMTTIQRLLGDPDAVAGARGTLPAAAAPGGATWVG